MSQSSDGAGTSPLQAELGGSSAGKWRYRAPGPLAVASNEGIDRTEPHLSFVHKMDLHPERVGSADDSFERLGSFERLSSVARNLAEKATTWATASMEFDVKLPGAGTSFLPGDGTGHATGQRKPHPNLSSPTPPRADEAVDGRPGFVPEHTSPHDRKITRLQSGGSTTSDQQALGHQKDPLTDFLRDMPSDEDIVFQGLILKRETGFAAGWREWNLFLTRTHFGLSAKGQAKVVDYRELSDLSTMTHLNHRGVRAKERFSPCSNEKYSVTQSVGRRRVKAAKGAHGATGVMSTLGPQLGDDRGRLGSDLEDYDFEIITKESEARRTKAYVFRCENEEDLRRWTEQFSVLVLENIYANEGKKFLERVRRGVQLLYYMPAFQYLVALIIVLNFAANVWEAQVINVAPRPDWMNPFFRDLDVVFTVIFTVELALNLVASGARGFVTSGWNWIDFVVVILAYVGAIFDGIPGLKVVRILRAFRVLRLVRRFESLRQLLQALGGSVLPIINAFVVLLLATSIFAILGVGLFREGPNNSELDGVSEFGFFSAALFTMFQTMSGEGWGSLAREMFVSFGDNARSGIMAFFLAFYLLVTLVLVNVVLTVFLDEFFRAAEAQKIENFQSQLFAGSDASKSAKPLDPLLRHISSNLADFGALVSEIHKLFAQLDLEGNGVVSYLDLSMGLAALPFRPTIEVTEEDYRAMTRGLTVCDPVTFGMTREDFQEVLLAELREYMQREAARAQQMQSLLGGGGSEIVLFVLKYAINVLEETRNILLGLPSALVFVPRGCKPCIVERLLPPSTSGDSPQPAIVWAHAGGGVVPGIPGTSSSPADSDAGVHAANPEKDAGSNLDMLRVSPAIGAHGRPGVHRPSERSRRAHEGQQQGLPYLLNGARWARFLGEHDASPACRATPPRVGARRAASPHKLEWEQKAVELLCIRDDELQDELVAMRHTYNRMLATTEEILHELRSPQ